MTGIRVEVKRACRDRDKSWMDDAFVWGGVTGSLLQIVADWFRTRRGVAGGMGLAFFVRDK